jgi:4-hydroxybenzoate polyprenyltransferase
MTAPATGSTEPQIARTSWMTRWTAQIRLRHWAHFLVLPLAGVDPTASYELAMEGVLRGVAIAFGVLAFGYLLNSLADRRLDQDPHKGSLPSGALTSQWLAVVGLGVVTTALAAQGPPIVLGAALLCMGSGVVYSVGPRLKSLPLIGSLLNISNFAPLLLVGLPGPDAQAPLLGPLLAAFAPLLLQNQLIHEAADAQEDRAGGVITTFGRFGPQRSAAVAALCGLCSAMAVMWPSPTSTSSSLAVLLAILFGGWYPRQLARRGQEPATMAALRVQHRFAALTGGGVAFGVRYFHYTVSTAFLLANLLWNDQRELPGPL